MTEALTFAADAIIQEREEVFANQGIPGDASVGPEIEELHQTAVELLVKDATPVGLLAPISRAEFRTVFDGEGRNNVRTPVADLIDPADSLALFAVTIGEAVCRVIAERFEANDFAVGCMLDSVASAATDRLADLVQQRHADSLRSAGDPAADGVLRYSPGYCGWDISGQRRLFEFLHPEKVGIRLTDSFLMQPLKSISGVMVAGPKDIHRLPADYPCCDACETRSCRDRVQALLAR
jgi:hypothetical protein